MCGGSSTEVVRTSLANTCDALREIYDGLRPSIERGFTEVTSLLDREEAYRYRVWITVEYSYISGIPGQILLDTRDQLNSYLQLVDPTTGAAAVERWQSELTPEARMARQYAEREDVFRLTGHVGDFEVISAAIETPLTLGETILGLADGAIALADLKSAVDDSHKGGAAGPTDHPVEWSGVGYQAYVATRAEFSTTLGGLVDIADQLTQAASDLLSSINDVLVSLAGLGSQMKSDLLSLVSGLADNLDPKKWLAILQTFASAIDAARESRESLLRDMASTAASNIGALTALMPAAREVSGRWPAVDGNITPGDDVGWDS